MGLGFASILARRVHVPIRMMEIMSRFQIFVGHVFSARRFVPFLNVGDGVVRFSVVFFIERGRNFSWVTADIFIACAEFFFSSLSVVVSSYRRVFVRHDLRGLVSIAVNSFRPSSFFAIHL